MTQYRDRHAPNVRSAGSLTRRPRQPETLADLIATYIWRDQRSINQIAQASLIDVAYLWRLRAGEKRRPSRDVLIRLALGLGLEPEELDELLIAADLAPITWRTG